MRTEDVGIFVGPDDGKALPNPIGGAMVVKVRDEDTAGAYSMNTMEAVLPAHAIFDATILNMLRSPSPALAYSWAERRAKTLEPYVHATSSIYLLTEVHIPKLFGA